jgi:hypothetical protein
MPTECGVAGGQRLRPDGGTLDAPAPIVPVPDSSPPSNGEGANRGASADDVGHATLLDRR